MSLSSEPIHQHYALMCAVSERSRYAAKEMNEAIYNGQCLDASARMVDFYAALPVLDIYDGHAPLVVQTDTLFWWSCMERLRLQSPRDAFLAAVGSIDTLSRYDLQAVFSGVVNLGCAAALLAADEALESHPELHDMAIDSLEYIMKLVLPNCGDEEEGLLFTKASLMWERLLGQKNLAERRVAVNEFKCWVDQFYPDGHAVLNSVLERLRQQWGHERPTVALVPS